MTGAALFDAGRRERAFLCAVTVGLVLLRSFVATYYEGFYFDSDQAIVGLMARRLSRFHDFPLFYYGLNYLLGVEAWIIAPFFWLARSSVALMRAPFVVLNAVVAVWLVRMLAARLSLRPAIAFVAALPFIMPTPAASGQLLELAGACVEPFVYVLLLWSIRRRPFAFGALLAVTYLHREFVIFTVPAIAILEARRPGFWTLATARSIALAACGFALVWLVVDDLKMHLSGGTLALQAASLRGQMCLTAPQLLRNAQSVVTEALPSLFGGRPLALAAVRMNTPLVAGWTFMGWLIAATLAVIVVRLAVRPRRRDGEPVPDGLGVYLAWIGFFTACAYPLSCNVGLGAPPLLRYLLLAILLPIGCCATFMQRDRSRRLRALVASVFVLWGGMNLWDNVRLIRESVKEPPSNEHRALVDYLLAHRIRYARAIYWDAYVVDFLSSERVITASLDVVRIPEYQQEVDLHADSAVTLARLPCEGTERVASWCVVGR
jgi:hypothetical protein